MRTLKCLLLHILRTTELQRVVIEVYLDEQDFSPFSDQLGLIIKMLTTGYNLTEPEHSHEFPMVKIDLLMPQIFAHRSSLLTDPTITHVYYNPLATPLDLTPSLVTERNADQTLP